ncbi:hypothetical protein TRFO_18412 [Tritrichomonas foetus]|uniref:DUF3447 domain-containing protein n=1 Tax=Tritrichomonas foetus TaxID=1144522 RepID=A0A1J4KLX0_9EUKA|nr:hypothetical protein TRFO_18412 [Tritrichomonas foetus]|eukprot:OHT11936.1 hypothetical protein TRFO_18412 [Tritrichomonas foetus]
MEKNDVKCEQLMNIFREDMSVLLMLQNYLLNFIDNSKILQFYEMVIETKIHQNNNMFSEFLSLLSFICAVRPKESQSYIQLLIHFIPLIKENFSQKEIYQLFSPCKQFIILLYEHGCINLNDILGSREFQDHDSFIFFPEIQENDEKYFLELKKYVWFNQLHIYYTNKMTISEFKEKRLLGLSEFEIVKIISEDKIDDFIDFVSSKNLDVFSKPATSVFEYDPLIKGMKPDLIEYAAYFGSIHIFKYLLMQYEVAERLLDKNIFYFAVSGGSTEIIHLIESKEKINYSLYVKYAIKTFQIDLVNYLFNQNPENLRRDIYYCIEFFNLEALLLFLAVLNEMHFTISYIEMAAMCGYVDLLSFFIKISDFDINSEINDGVSKNNIYRTLLHIAVNSEKYNVVAFLLTLEGIDINIKNYIYFLICMMFISGLYYVFTINYETPLDIAMQLKNTKIIEILQKKEESIHKKSTKNSNGNFLME